MTALGWLLAAGGLHVLAVYSIAAAVQRGGRRRIADRAADDQVGEAIDNAADLTAAAVLTPDDSRLPCDCPTCDDSDSEINYRFACLTAEAP